MTPTFGLIIVGDEILSGKRADKHMPKVIELFLDEESQHLAGLSDFIGKPISLQSENAMAQEQYDIVLL